MSQIEINIPDIEEINRKLDLLMNIVGKQINDPKCIVLDNDDFMKMLKISKSKAAMLRNEGKITYSKESQTGKVWYLLSDVLDFLDRNKYEKFKN